MIMLIRPVAKNYNQKNYNNIHKNHSNDDDNGIKNYDKNILIIKRITVILITTIAETTKII